MLSKYQQNRGKRTVSDLMKKKNIQKRMWKRSAGKFANQKLSIGDATNAL